LDSLIPLEFSEGVYRLLVLLVSFEIPVQLCVSGSWESYVLRGGVEECSENWPDLAVLD
jgi:hypothetical protein